MMPLRCDFSWTRYGHFGLMDTIWTSKTTYLVLLRITLESQKIPYLRHFLAISNGVQTGVSVDYQLSDTFLTSVSTPPKPTPDTPQSSPQGRPVLPAHPSSGYTPACQAPPGTHSRWHPHRSVPEWPESGSWPHMRPDPR